ncbi:MAG: hypothetical protein V4736_10410 [Bdellovibrionota bacterium]
MKNTNNLVIVFLTSIILASCTTPTTKVASDSKNEMNQESNINFDAFRKPADAGAFIRPNHVIVTFKKSLNISGHINGTSYPTMINADGTTWIYSGTKPMSDKSICGFYSNNKAAQTIRAGTTLTMREVYYKSEYAYTTLNDSLPDVTLHCGEYSEVASRVPNFYKNVFSVTPAHQN